MKRLSVIILSLIFVFSLASCANEKAQKDEPTEAQTQSQTQTVSPTAQSETESPYLKTDGKILKVNLNPESAEEINIKIYMSSPNEGISPTQKFIKDKKTIEKFIELINNTEFYMCENQEELRKPGTTMAVNIDDKISMSFEMDLRINEIYCEKPEELENDILEIFREAPEKEELIKFE